MAVLVEGRCGLCRAILLELCRATDDPGFCDAYLRYATDPEADAMGVFRRALERAGPDRVRLARDMLLRT